MKIVLASSSPRRKELLEQLGIYFSLRKASFKETSDLPPEKCVVFNAKGKCLSVDIGENEVALGADTIVVFKNEILGKPKDFLDAKSMLFKLSGNVHEVYTGLAIHYDNKIYYSVEKTLVTMRSLSDIEIDEYIKTGEGADKAGGYAIQGKGAFLIKKIEGCYFNVVGLPLVCMLELFKKAGISFEYKKFAIE